MQRWLAFWSSLNVHQSSASFPGELVARRPRLTLGAALVAATVALAALISPSVASAQFDFNVTTSGPQNVVQGPDRAVSLPYQADYRIDYGRRPHYAGASCPRS